ncbi:hypothetical protein H257_16478 [Aphanomyces astaci]|uniref:DDE Tnp4 domain-containing protein n=1 Tax=Aphanomyces astaci TaxID=112090 RepID=W4FIB1_APHAT|nr:hypothetical protein H257_16478 [Aphanomyces astaci]ETV67225.1 hypothetical protein H257_16478 [Aphanomyces astaci]|eukprot:XP_009843213.1 hypothetical protein H257_16478 [Aphanomyces astaci]
MLGDARYEQWFHGNLRCDQAVLRRLVDLLRQRLHPNECQSSHSFEKKVAVKLYFLGSEGGYRETAAAFGMAKSWYITVVATMVDVLASQAKLWIRLPTSPRDWSRIERGFYKVQRFPGVVRAVDGTLIDIQRPREYDGFYNRSGDPSLNVQAMVDHRMVFLSVDIRPGSFSDKKIWKVSQLGQTIRRCIPTGSHVIGDSGYTLLPGLLTPYVPHEEGGRLSNTQKRFNYKLSSTRMVVECAFGRLKERFRILKTVKNERSLDRTVAITTCCFVLHNLFIHFNDGLFDAPC